MSGRMRYPILLALLTLSCSLDATTMGFGRGGLISFPMDPDCKITATWGADESALDISEDGLGCDKCTEMSSVSAWVMTSPIPLGSNGQPWDNADISISVFKTSPTADIAKDKVFIRHSPDLKHWTTWQVIGQQPEKPKPDVFPPPYTVALAIPKSIRTNYRLLCDEFAGSNPTQPFQHANAVRWILSRNPNYFSEGIPFIGYLQVLVETRLSNQRRIRGIHVSANSVIDDMLYRLSAREREELQGPWVFVAEDQIPAVTTTEPPQS